MLNARLQSVTIIVTTIAGVVFFVYGHWPEGILAILVAGFLLYGKLRFGTVYQALRHLYKGDLKRTENILQSISKPDKLRKPHKGYYHFCWGYLKMARQNWSEAAKHFEKALEFGIKLPNDQAVTHVSLADIYIRKKKREKAIDHLEKAKALKHNKAVMEAISKTEAKLQ